MESKIKPFEEFHTPPKYPENYLMLPTIFFGGGLLGAFHGETDSIIYCILGGLVLWAYFNTRSKVLSKSKEEFFQSLKGLHPETIRKATQSTSDHSKLTRKMLTKYINETSKMRA